MNVPNCLLNNHTIYYVRNIMLKYLFKDDPKMLAQGIYQKCMLKRLHKSYCSRYIEIHISVLYVHRYLASICLVCVLEVYSRTK